MGFGTVFSAGEESVDIQNARGQIGRARLTTRSFLAGVNASGPSASTANCRGTIADLISVHVLIDGPEREIIVWIRRDANVFSPEVIGFILSSGSALAQDWHSRTFNTAAGHSDEERRRIIVATAAVCGTAGDRECDAEITVRIHCDARQRIEKVILRVLEAA